MKKPRIIEFYPYCNYQNSSEMLLDQNSPQIQRVYLRIATCYFKIHAQWLFWYQTSRVKEESINLGLKGQFQNRIEIFIQKSPNFISNL